jgi:hypothetical protein
MDRPVKFAIAVTALAGLPFIEEARAVDLAGAWAANSNECHRVFIRRGRANQVGFTAFSERYGGGFIVEADRLRGKSASCRVETRKEDGETINIVAAYATDIMLSKRRCKFAETGARNGIAPRSRKAAAPPQNTREAVLDNIT